MATLNSTKLEEALSVLCLDCTRYDASDQLAMVLAIVSLTPYLAIFQVASVSGFHYLLFRHCHYYCSRAKASPILVSLLGAQGQAMLSRWSTAEDNSMMPGHLGV